VPEPTAFHHSRRKARAARYAQPVLREGDPAPDFTLTSDRGEAITLSSLRGKPVVLYFYPKDDSRASFCSSSSEK
jgi:peroxiredoxin